MDEDIKTYYWTDRWNPSLDKWNRYIRHEDFNRAKEGAQWWTDITGYPSRIVEVKERIMVDFTYTPNDENAKA